MRSICTTRTRAKLAAPHSGFTLIELMIVIAIIGILAAIAIPQFSKYRQRACNTNALNDVRNARTDLEAHYAEYQHYPY